ncbi:MAG: YecA family protein [Gammaproteobacteria bacterium]|nr:MAG: YecA family protein [Gammaproteobacteria bacterium]
MNDLVTPLTDEELDRLDRFLLDRIDEDADTQDMDEGVLDVSELDGLFTALVSGPVSVVPSKWLPLVWGDFEPVWDSQEAFQEIFSLMIRHMNSIVHLLIEYPEEFEPLFLGREVEGNSYTIVDEWCEGYQRGVELNQESWDTAGAEMAELFVPIFAFTPETNWRGHDLNDKEKEITRQAIVPNVRKIHAYWLDRRAESGPATQPIRRSTPRVGRNDLCPCGSGKKYKKCCLH